MAEAGPWKIFVRWMVTQNQVVTYRDNVAEKILSIALEKKKILSRANALVRELSPNLDLGQSTDKWQVTLGAGDSETVAYSGELSDKKVAAIYGVALLTGVPIYKIRFRRGAAGNIVSADVYTEDALALGADHPKIGLFELPYIIPPNSSYSIGYYAYPGFSGATAYVKLLGVTVEKIKEVYAPDQVE